MQRYVRILQVACFALLGGCSSGSVWSGVPQGGQAMSSPLHGVAAPASARQNIYVGLGLAGHYGVLAYAGGNRKNHPPLCTLQAGGENSDVAADENDNLVAVNSEYFYVYQGPGTCGTLLGSAYTYGFSEDVASNDAINGKIIVANVYSFQPTGFGDVGICTLSGGCTIRLTNSNVSRFFGVALAKNGDCWGSGFGYVSQAVLIYFKGCTGSGQLATGYQNKYPGGIDIDKHGNLVTVDPDATGKGPGFWVYKGCKPKCALIGGEFTAAGGSQFGHLNANSTAYASADYQYGQIDVYAYSPTKMTYKYSFNNGLSANDEVEGVTYVPRSKE
jgi:hypothetical protein